MLSLDVNRLREGVAPLERKIEPAALPQDDEYVALAPVQLTATTAKDKGRVRIAGRVEATLSLACSRCLESHVVPTDTTFDLLYLPVAEAPAGTNEVEVDDEDINAAFYEDSVIDLRELVHEQLYLALPMKPLCKDDCLGLCPICGANRNTTTCTCEARWEDPRLAGLKTLLNENDDA
jgi:uncharacterized protein